MTWISTWPHAREVIKSKRALVATAFWSENTPMTKENVA